MAIGQFQAARSLGRPSGEAHIALRIEARRIAAPLTALQRLGQQPLAQPITTGTTAATMTLTASWFASRTRPFKLRGRALPAVWRPLSVKHPATRPAKSAVK